MSTVSVKEPEAHLNWRSRSDENKDLGFCTAPIVEQGWGGPRHVSREFPSPDREISVQKGGRATHQRASDRQCAKCLLVLSANGEASEQSLQEFCPSAVALSRRAKRGDDARLGTGTSQAREPGNVQSTLGKDRLITAKDTPLR